MLIESVIRSIETLIGQWLLVEASFKSMFDETVEGEQNPDKWPYRLSSRESATDVRARIANQKRQLLAYVPWAPAGQPDNTSANQPGSIRWHVRILREKADLLQKAVPNSFAPSKALEELIHKLRIYFQFTSIYAQVLQQNLDQGSDAGMPSPVPPATVVRGVPDGVFVEILPMPPIPAPDPFPNRFEFAQPSGFWNYQSPAVAPDPESPPRVSIRVAQERLADLHRFIRGEIDNFSVILSDLGTSIGVHGIREGVDNISAFPLLTSEIGGGGYGGGGGRTSISSPSGTGSLQRLVDQALSGVLGRLPRVQDQRSFLAALKQSFVLSESQGATVVRYEPRTFSGQTELGGGVTGAQASLYSRASAALDKALPLLDGLEPLLTDADPEDTAAMQAIVRNELVQIVGELKTEGGPRVARVDVLFDSLLGTDGQQGHFLDLSVLYGFDNDALINTLDEELQFSNFLAVRDYASQIRQAWQEFRGKNSIPQDLGTRLVRLSRALSVTAESVDEVCAAMDSVFVGPAERQIATFPDANDGGRRVLVSELLSWIATFTSEEAPRLILDGGRRGAAAIEPTAIRLESLLRQLIQSIPTEPGLPAGLRHTRVRFPLKELHGYLDQVQQLAAAVQQPLRSGA